ncbi:MAG: glycosyltransferase [Acidobacteriota bacterium]
MNTILPSFAIVIEWENVLLAELSGTVEMLRCLRKELRDVGGQDDQPEMIIMYDSQRVSPDLIRGTIAQVFPGDSNLCATKLVATQGKRYYELKNESLKHTNKDVVVFLDSDVVPEDGWLLSLLKAFCKPEVQVVCGNTFVLPKGLYGKAMALFWFFPLRQDEEGLIPAERFFANNVAFRREVLRAFPFPDLPQFRGQCTELARTLRTNGIDIHLHRSARVRHPLPNGWFHFVCRALCEGHDNQIEAQRLADQEDTPTRNPLRRYWASLREVYWSIRKNHANVSLGWMGGVAAFGLAHSYFTLVLVGEILTSIRPSIVRRCFSI